MKKWDAAELSMVILSSTVPLSIVGLIVMRLMTGQPLSENAGGVINNVLNIVGGGVIGIIAMKLSTKKANRMPNVLPDFHKLAAIKEHFEGYKNIAYKDSGGVWTIGFGSTYNHDQKRKVQDGDTIHKEQAIRWMATDTNNILNDLNKYIKTQLNPAQSAAIVDYTYNRGIGNLLKTQLDELINANPFDPLIVEEIKKTGLKDRMGNLLWGLGRRRLAEAYLYQTGILKFDWPRWK